MPKEGNTKAMASVPRLHPRFLTKQILCKAFLHEASGSLHHLTDFKALPHIPPQKQSEAVKSYQILNN